jgi:His/Glu/Gln/Arg/opine family amino acid ABC transporter permease subunit
VDYNWNFSGLSQYAPLWGQGLLNTLLLSMCSIALGTVLAAALYVARRSRHSWIRGVALAYTDVFRALPVFVLLSLIFFVMPILTGWRISAWQCAFFAFSFNLAPFVAEVIRGGIESVPAAQYESGKVLGLRDREIFRYIIAPQALQRIIPPLLGEWITTIKLTSIASVIGVQEIWNVGGQIVSRTSLTIEARIVTAGLYLLIIMPLIWLLTWLERRHGLRGVMASIGPS